MPYDHEERKRQRRDHQQRSRQLAKQGHGRLTIPHSRRKDPATLAAEAAAKLRPEALRALLDCYRAPGRRIRADSVPPPDLAALRKAHLLRRWEDPETGERSREWYELAPQGRWAAQGLDAAARRERASE